MSCSLLRPFLCPPSSLLPSFRSLSVRAPLLLRGQSHLPRQERIATTSDGAVVVCWHPETDFPYECTRPVPRAKTGDTNEKLKVQSVTDMKELYHHKPFRIMRRDLMRLTWTPKHKWAEGYEMANRRRVVSTKHERERPFL